MEKGKCNGAFKIYDTKYGAYFSYTERQKPDMIIVQCKVKYKNETFFFSIFNLEF